MLDERKIQVLNALSEMTPQIMPGRPEQFMQVIRTFTDDLRKNYPDVGDDDLASLLFDQAQGLSWVLAAIPAENIPGALANMVVNLGQSAVELSRLTRDQEI